MSYPDITGPVTSKFVDWMKSIFGEKFRVSRGYLPEHDGIDLPAKAGTPVKAIASGMVSYARDARKQTDKGLSAWAKGGGNTINIDVGGQMTTQYAHLASILVKEGQYVQAGQIIGYVGSTGGLPDSPTANFGASNAHLHFGLWDRKANRMINPQSFLENLGDTSSYLGGWGDQIQIPTNEPLTQEYIDYIMKTLKQNGWFSGDSVLGGSETKTREILESHKGEPWNKNLQLALQSEFDSAALSAGDPIAAVGQQLVDTFTWLGMILVGLVLIGGGIYLLGGMSQAKNTVEAVT